MDGWPDVSGQPFRFGRLPGSKNIAAFHCLTLPPWKRFFSKLQTSFASKPGSPLLSVGSSFFRMLWVFQKIDSYVDENEHHGELETKAHQINLVPQV